MSTNLRTLQKGLKLEPVASTGINAKGELETLSTGGKLNYHNGTTASPVVTEAHTATLTNKTLTAPVINSPTGIVKADVGLGNVDNTSDATKNAAAVTLTNKTITSPVITTPTGIVKGDVGLGNVDNTSDANKPVSTATQTALDLKANLANPTFSGTITTPLTASRVLTTGSSFELAVSAVTTTTLGFLDVTSSAQTQINTKTQGPATSTDNAVVRFDGTNVKVIQNSGVLIDDSNNIVTPGSIYSGAGTIDSKAQTQIDSTTKGVLFPRMTTTQRDAIVSPPTSLWIFNTSTGLYNFYSGASWSSVDVGTAPITPTITRLTVGSGTYTTPVGVRYIKVKAVGPGGGGSGSGGAGSLNGSSGSASTTFGSSLLTATAGGGASTSVGSSSSGGTGGSATVNSPAILINSLNGESGQGGCFSGSIGFMAGGAGGASFFTGAGKGTSTSGGGSGKTNTGSGGAGGSMNATATTSGAGGGAGAYLEAIISSPSATYAYVIGSGGAGGSAGSSGFGGGAGADGLIIVEEYY